MARRSAQPLFPGPSPSPSPRPGLSSLLGSFSSLPASPPPRHTKQGRLPHPKSHQLSGPSPPHSSHLSGAHRNCRPGGSSGRPPSSLLAFSSLTGEGRPEEGEARSRGGRRSGRSARSCFPAFRREKKERGTSGLRARRRRRPLYRAAPAGLRATPASASIPTPPPPAPRFPRAAPHSASSSHAAAQGYEPPPPPRPRPRSPCARPSPLPRRRLPCGLDRKRGGRTPCFCSETPGAARGEQRRAGGARPLRAAFQWDSFPAGRFGPPRGGREATSNNIGAGVVGTTFCGSAGPPLAPLFVRRPLEEPGGAPAPCRLPPGSG